MKELLQLARRRSSIFLNSSAWRRTGFQVILDRQIVMTMIKLVIAICVFCCRDVCVCVCEICAQEKRHSVQTKNLFLLNICKYGNTL